MANQFYNEAFQGQAGQTARAEHVKVELSTIGAGFDMAEEIFGRTIQAPEGERALPSLPPAGARAGRFLRFNSAGDPEAVQSGFTWRGQYAAGVPYAVGDVFKHGIYGTIYIVTEAHVSGATPDPSRIDVMIDLQGLNIIRNEIRTSSFTATPGGDYLVNSSGGNVVITLPSGPTIADAPINVTHIGGSLAAGQAITVARNGHRIMGLAEDLQVDTANASFSLMYANTARGWVLRVLA